MGVFLNTLWEGNLLTMEIQLKWNSSQLNKMIGVVFSDNINVTTTTLRNIQKLINTCNFTPYQNKSTIIRRVEFLKKALYAKLDEGLEDEEIVIQYAKGDNPDAATEEIVNNIKKYKQLGPRDLKYVVSDVEDKLRFGVVQEHASKMREILDRMENMEGFSTYAQVVETVSRWVSDYNVMMREVRTQSDDETLNLNDENIIDRIKDVLKRLGSTSSIIITGIQMLNEMLSPGLRPGKLYVFLGLTGGFKSAMLLKLVIDAIRYNSKSYKTKEPGMRPVVLYITLENTKDESFARMYNMTVKADDIENHSAEEIVKSMKKVELIGNPDMDCILIYKANMSIDTQDIRNIIDDLHSEGKEVVLLSLDYLKRVRSYQKSRDEKEELKNVSNELRTIAIDYFIPVVSAQQMNRSGLATVNSAMRDNKADLARFLGGENVGSAYEIMENADMTIILNLERRKTDGRLFLTFYRIKERYRPHTKLDYFNQPFVADNEIMLYDDLLDPKAAGVISLATDMEGIDQDMLYAAPQRHNKFKFPNMTKGVKTEDTFDLQPLT